MNSALLRARAIALAAVPRVADRLVRASNAPLIQALIRAEDAVIVRRIVAARATNVLAFKRKVKP